MKIIYDNIICSLQKTGGISVYWNELIKRMLEKKQEMHFLMRSDADNLLIRQDLLPNIRVLPKRFLGLDRFCNIKTNFDSRPHIFHSSYYRLSKSKQACNVVTVHDFTYEKFLSGMGKVLHTTQKFNAIKKADLVICVSQNTKKDLLAFLPKTNQSKIKVVYNGVSDNFFRTNQTIFEEEGLLNVLNEKYLLFVGQRKGYKNFACAVEAMKHLPVEYKLICVGSGFSEDEVTLVKPFADRIISIKFPSQHDLNILYNSAFCLIYPSLYEGFGIPVAEAMKCCCPVVAANTSSIPEVAGNAAILIDDITAKKIADSVLSLENKETRETLIAKGILQAQNFNWDKCCDQTLDAYKQLFEKKRNEFRTSLQKL